jgi:phage shock protein A
VLANFEKSVAKEEATAKAFDELASAGKDSNLEAEFAQLEGHTVDAELAALKRERLGRVELPKELPPPSGR